MTEQIEVGDPAPPTPAVEPGQLENPEFLKGLEETQLPEKFQGEGGARRMLEAYMELERKQNEAPAEPAEAPAESSTEQKPGGLGIPKPQPAENPELGQLFERISGEFQETQQLTEKHYSELAKAGISKDIADSWVQGQAARQALAEQETMGLVGGAENYAEMMSWAQANLTEPQVNAYNAAVQDPQQRELAVRGLAAQWQQAGGAPAQQRLQGSQHLGGAQPFRSWEECQRAMLDPRYRDDPAYIQEVEARMAVSNLNIS